MITVSSSILKLLLLQKIKHNNSVLRLNMEAMPFWGNLKETDLFGNLLS